MRYLLVLLCLAIAVVRPSSALAQSPTPDSEGLKKEVERLERENELLKSDNQRLKQEVESLKYASATKSADKGAASPFSATVDNVEYVYQGITRNGANVYVTLLATSQKGDQQALHGSMILIDEDGDRYKSEPLAGGRTRLREGVPVKLVWRFGPNVISGKSSAPSQKITHFVSLSVAPTVGSQASAIDFRDVPVEVAKQKAK